MENRSSPKVIIYFLLIFAFVLVSNINESKVEAAGVYFEVDTERTEVYHNINGKLTRVGELPQGQEFERVGYQKYWQLIDFGSQKGYVKRSESTITDGGSIRNKERETTNREIKLLKNATVYETSTDGYVPFAQVDKGTTFEVVVSQKNWWGINVGGRFGFINKSSATVIFEPSDVYFKVNADIADVYYNIGGKMEKVGELEYGQEYRRAGGRTDWHLIEFGSRKAHVKKSVTEPSDGEIVKKDPKRPESTSLIAIAKDTQIYDISSGNYVPFAQINSDVQFNIVLEQSNWWGINVGGRFGLIKKSSTKQETIKYTNYNYSFEKMVDAQMTGGRATANGSGTKLAKREEVEYYANPSNFTKGDVGFFQFLVLSKSAGLTSNDAKIINDKILNSNAGILAGQAQAFIDAGREYDINEIYLIAHALHETGNGDSTLANGVPVDANGKVTRDANGRIVENSNTKHIVYNMYGYGANDSCPIDCGAKYAFDKKWFSKTASIIGGASSIYSYINRGQDTLYKMKWNPESPGYPQYATHIMWAVLQTPKMNEIYSLINSYDLVFDVPQFLNQPSTSGSVEINSISESGTTSTESSPSQDLVVNYPEGVYGITETVSGNLNFRSTPNTDEDNIIGSISSGTKIEITGTNGTWYQINYDDKSGWVHSDFVNVQNLLEVTATDLNIRTGAGTSYDSIGKVNTGELLAAIMVDGEINTKAANNHIWYQIIFNNEEAWVSGGTNGTEYIKVK
ncbi:SH3 domain-containing protein [Oceanobacillus salinisoli]|uniref:SH3 domain-containing protein n=1 Tax=Oceanobacillus salinisoli TaxID=2678611 RepID=UPI0012E32533|nr:SH3 domain-containing protein [Oceanobacillus salinisoli]